MSSPGCRINVVLGWIRGMEQMGTTERVIPAGATGSAGHVRCYFYINLSHMAADDAAARRVGRIGRCRVGRIPG